MELPKNITQVGEVNHNCKIYVEDYVISYMKQLNQVARDKDMAVALYGVKKEEDNVSYLFLYGACKLTFLQRETRHLSQAQLQEIEKYRQRYFKEYTFLGYRLLNGEMIEGVHVCEQGICRYISGYAQFYEKNDSMLAYMLDVREEVRPEVVEQEKYDVVKKRQEERKNLYGEERYKDTPVSRGSRGISKVRFAVVAVFAVLCLVGLTSMDGEGKMGYLQQMAKQVIGDIWEKQIPDAPDDTGQVDTLVAENELVEAVQKENEQSVGGTETVTPAMSVVVEGADTIDYNGTGSANTSNMTPASQTMEGFQQTGETEATQLATQQLEQQPAVQQPAVQQPEEQVVINNEEPVSYTIKKGDTLIGISKQYYGNEAAVSEICALNGIGNPDDIKVGEKILLP